MKKTAKKSKAVSRLNAIEKTEFLEKLDAFLRDKDVGAMVVAECLSTYTYGSLDKKEVGHLKKELSSIQRAAAFALQEVERL